MRLSVIMSAYNEKEIWLKQSIESVLNQTFSDFEFLIILDNPNAENLKNLIKSYSERDARIRFYVNEKNSGLVYSLNRALNLARGEYIVRMDADDISEIDRFEKEFKVLTSEKLDLVGSMITIIDENDKENGFMNIYGTTPDTCVKSLKYRSCIVHPTWMFRKKLVDNFGGYYNVPTAEDYEFLCRMAVNGAKMKNINDNLLKYRRRESGISLKNSYQQYQIARIVRNNYCRVIKKNKDYNVQDILQDIEKIEWNKIKKRFIIGQTLYLKGCNQKSKKHIIRGTLSIILSCIISSEIFENIKIAIGLKKVNN